jgi:hypothetical protein
MNKTKKDDAVVKQLHKISADKRKAAFKTFPVVEAVRGFWLFAEGTALLVTSLYAIYQGHYGDLPVWGKDILTVAGVLVLVPAALLLAKFFRAAAKA